VSRAGLLLLCMMAFLSGEGGVLLKQLPGEYAIGVAMVCGVLGCVSWWRGGTTNQQRGDAPFEQFIAEMKGVCPWMTWDDTVLMRQAFSSVNPLSRGDGDLDVVAQAALRLAERARATGDERRAWVCWQRYLEVCAWQQGQEYPWPALPQELEEV
jgi:hypothetical protein